jgi:PAS domain-containing protein
MFYYEKFREIRKQQKLTTPYIAQKLAVSKTTISFWERGKRNPPDRAVKQLANILNINISEISNLPDIKPDIDMIPNDLSNFTKSWFTLNKDDASSHIETYVAAMNKLRHINNDINQSSIVIKALLSSFQSAFYIKGTDNKYITANAAFLKLVKFDKDFIVTGHDDFKFLSLKDAKINALEDEQILYSGKSIIHEKKIIIGSRNKRIGLVTKTPVLDNKGRLIGLVGNFTDITDIEEANRQNLLLRNCIETTPFVVWFGSTAGNNLKDLKVQYINGHVEKIFGIKKAEYINSPIYIKKHVFSAYKEEYKKLFTINSKFPKILEYKYEHPEKGIRWLESSIFNKESTYFGFVRDITDDKKHSEEIQKINTILSNTNTAIIIKKNNSIVDANQSAALLYEKTIEELKTNPLIWWESILEEDLYGSNDPIAKLSSEFSKKKRRVNLKYRIKTINNNIKHVEEYLYSTKIENEEYWCCELRDVTLQTKKENRHKALERAVESSDILIWTGHFTEKGYIYTYVSSHVKDIYGIERAEFYKNTNIWMDFIIKDDKKKVIEWLDSDIDKKNIEYRIVTKENRLKWLHHEINKGSNNEYSGHIKDITATRKLEEENNALHQS